MNRNLVWLMLALAPLCVGAQVVADSATNTLSNVTTNITGDVTIGTNGSFTLLLLSDNALLTNSVNGLIGRNNTANSNEVRLVSPSARWSVGGSLYVGNNGAANRLVVSNGATVLAATDSTIGFGVDFTGNANSNIVTVTGAGSLWSNRLDLNVGQLGFANRLEVNNGGWVVNSNAFVGRSIFSSSNTVVVTGAGSVWSNRADVNVGSAGSWNLLVVSNGGWMVNSNASVGESSLGNLALVTGTNSTWSNRANLYVGNGASGNQLVVSNGAVVYGGGHGTLGGNGGANSNSVTVTGPGTSLLIASNLYVGGKGAFSHLIVSNGAVVEDYDGIVCGNVGGSNNVALVTDAGSLWSNRFGVFIGYAGPNNQLIVSNGGCVASDITALSSSRSNLLLVTGFGSVFSNASSLTVDGPGNRLVIEAGGLFHCVSALFGASGSAYSNNEAVVTGPGSIWANGGSLWIGEQSPFNRLVVSNGAVLRSLYGVVGGFSSAAVSNQAVVTGSGSLWSNQLVLTVGDYSSLNRLVVSNGATVLGSNSNLGFDTSGSNNFAVVTGPGSAWYSDTLNVGFDGAGNQLVVSNSGLAYATNAVVLGANSPSTNNRVVVDGGALRATNAAVTGLLDIRRGTNVFNAGLIEANQLLLTNTQGFFEFKGGTLITRGATISSSVPFMVGTSGTTPAIWDVRTGSNHFLSIDLHIGNNSSFNQLILTNGALLTNNSICILGLNFGANSNTATLAGAGSQWSLSGVVFVGDFGSGNRLVVSNGAALATSSTSVVGYQLGCSNNEAVITGPGTSWTSGPGQLLFVGASGRDNRLRVEDGALVTSAYGSIGGASTGSNNLAVVTGLGSSWSNSVDLRVGDAGAGNQLVVSNNAVVSAASAVYVGFDPASTKNRLTVDGGTLRATNAAGTSVLDVRRGTNVLNAGLVDVDVLRLTNTLGFFQFNGGTLSVKNSTVNNGQVFRVGNGSSAATMQLQGGTHTFANQLFIGSGAFLVGNGTVIGTLFLFGGGKLIPGIPPGGIGKMIFTNTPSLAGTVAMEISKNGPVLTNDQVQVVTGTLTYGGSLIVSNLGPTALSNGDNFRLFNATNYAGSFTSLTLPPLSLGLDWTNKLTVDGSIEVFSIPPGDRFWTNALGGSYEVFGNWLNSLPPGPQDNANFTNNASYQISWGANALAANAFFNVGSGAATLTQAIGSASWTLTNSYVVGQNARAAVTHVSGSLRVTNSQGTARLIVGLSASGTFLLTGGEVVTDTLLATQGAASIFIFNSGAWRTRNSTVAKGSTFLVGDGASSATLELLGGTNDFVNNLSIQSQAVLMGTGTLSGFLAVQAGGQLSPGAASGPAALGKIVCLNSPFLDGATLMDISRSGATATNDQLQVIGSLTYGGTLTVSNLGPAALAIGDRFPLFSASGYGGAFSAVSLPTPPPGLNWTNKLLVDGSIEVIAGPKFTSVTLSGTNVIFSGTGGIAGANYAVLTATNVATPLSNWVSLVTNQFDSGGNFSFTNSLLPGELQRYFRTRTP